MSVILIDNKQIMNEQEDEFFVEPEIEEVQDIKLVEEANPIIDKPISEQPKHVPLKFVQIPKEPQNLIYRPFRFDHPQSDDDGDDEEVHYDYESPFTQFYDMEQCVYQRLPNQQFNRINGTMYFCGAFLHRNIFTDDNYSETYELEQATKQFYEPSTNPLPSPKPKDLIFNSHFQSANLFAAFKIGPFQYDLVMSNDVNSVGNNQWFYFSVKGMIPNKDYTFSVVNFTKSDSLFNYGMAPAVYSVVESKQLGLERGWRRVGQDVKYKKGAIPRQNSRRMYYKLQFKLSTPHDNDQLYIAHSYPYTLQKLNKYLTDKINKFKDTVTKITIGKTLSKRNIEALLICHPINKKRDNRKAIFVMARQHPGQTQGSYVCEGVIDKLLNRSKQSEFLIKNFVFYVIPMVNPDGVAFGHYRTNLTGKDLNRKWNITDKDQSCPEVTSIKAFILEISKERQVRFILDLHGHSKKLNSFFYGNPCPQNPDVVRIFPYVCSKLHSGVQYLDCTFAAEEYKRKAARVYLSFLHRLVHVYTFESSFYAYFKEGHKIEFTPKQYRQLGGTLITALFMQLEHEVRFQQSFEFNLKKANTKQFNNSPFVKMLGELKNNKALIEQGTKNESGSESQPQATEVNNEELEKIKPVRPASSNSSVRQSPNVRNKSRRGIRDNKQYTFNKPIRNIKFLQISRVNSILPDKYQLGLQPIRKKDIPVQVNKPQTATTKITGETQTESKQQLKNVQFKQSEIEQCQLSSSLKLDSSPERKFSSVIRTNNRNIIFKFDIFGNTTARPQETKPKVPLVFKHAYSQTMITYSKEGGEKIRTSQILPQVETPDREKQARLRSNSIKADPSLRSGVRREAELFFNGMMKKLMSEKEAARSEHLSNKFVLQKPLSIKKKQISRK